VSWEIWAGTIRPTVDPLPQRVHRGAHPWPTSERHTAVDIRAWTGPNFREQAVCTEADPEAFFPDKGISAKPAKDLCKRCPAIVECLDWAMEHNEQFGVWAGTTPDERKALRRKKAS
jgi:hypothetical protein